METQTPPPPLERLGKALESLREAQGIVKRTIVTKMCNTNTTIKNIETGKSQYTIGIFMAYCNEINLDLVALIEKEVARKILTLPPPPPNPNRRKPRGTYKKKVLNLKKTNPNQ